MLHSRQRRPQWPASSLRTSAESSLPDLMMSVGASFPVNTAFCEAMINRVPWTVVFRFDGLNAGPAIAVARGADEALAAIGVDGHGEAQVHSQSVVLLFVGGLVLQYVVTGFATGVAAPAISALGDSSVQGRLMGLQSGMEQTGRGLAPLAQAARDDACGSRDACAPPRRLNRTAQRCEPCGTGEAWTSTID